MQFKYLVFIFICCTLQIAHAQELKCEVKVLQADRNGQTDQEVFDAMQKSVSDLMNSTKWTEHSYENHERIDCSILIKVTDNISNTQFKAEMQVQARRPIYNTSYNSTSLLINDDKVTFSFNQFDPLQYTENVYTDELTALLSFYAYMILGNDYDTFEKNGGQAFYEKALNIVNISSSASGAEGWKAGESEENRYWLINNTLDQFYQPLRDCNYIYYREGFDTMEKNLEQSRKNITKALKSIESIHRTKPNNYNVTLFFYSRADELINLYRSAPNNEKVQMTQFLKRVNTPNVARYNKILKPY